MRGSTLPLAGSFSDLAGAVSLTDCFCCSFIEQSVIDSCAIGKLGSSSLTGKTDAEQSSKTTNAKIATVQPVQTNRQAQGFGITEFSSSSARTSSQKH